MLNAVIYANCQGHVASGSVGQNDVAVLKLNHSVTDLVFSLIIVGCASDGDFHLSLLANGELGTACGIEGDVDGISLNEGIVGSLGGDTIYCTLVLIAVIHVDRQGHGAGLVARDVDALLVIVGLLAFAGEVGRVGDQHIVADGAGRGDLHIHYITHGVGLGLGICGQRDADSFTCGDVEGDGLRSLASVVVEVLDGNRQGNLANLVARNRYVALLVGSQRGLANLVGYFIFADGVLHFSNLNLDYVTNGVVRLGLAHREGDGGSGSEGVSASGSYLLQALVQSGNSQGYSNSLVVRQGYIALVIGSQCLCLDLLINGVSSYIFNIAVAYNVLDSDFHLSLVANGVSLGFGIQSDRQRFVLHLDGVAGGSRVVLVAASIGSGNGSSTSITGELNFAVLVDLGNLNLGIVVGNAVGYFQTLGIGGQRGSREFLAHVQLNLILREGQGRGRLGQYVEGLADLTCVVFGGLCGLGGDGYLTLGVEGNLATFAKGNSALGNALVGHLYALRSTGDSKSDLVADINVCGSLTKCQLNILLDELGADQVQLRCVGVIIL